MRLQSISLLLLAWASAGLRGMAEDWPRFRGPTGQGHSTEKGLPLTWSSTQGIAWKREIPGQGWSSPVTWGGRVYVTTVSDAGTRCRVLALEQSSGSVVWDVVVHELVPLRKEQKNSYASATPVTDGRRVYAVFGDGTIVAVDADGRLVWKNSETRHYSRHGLGASPILHEGLLIMPFDGSNRVEKAGDWPNNSAEEQLGWRVPWEGAEIVAVDVNSGRRAWVARRGRSRVAHVTPNIVRVDDRPQLVSPAGDVIQGFDPKTGERLWSAYSQGEGVTPSFAAGDGMVFTASGFEKTTLRTVRVGGRGDVTATHVAWEQRRGTPTQASLLYVSPHLYAITDGGIAHCYHGRTGDVVYSERVGGNHCASPVAAEGRIYFLSEEGETTVIRSGTTFEILSRNPLGERCQASMAVSDGSLLIRSERHLWCVR